MAKKSKKAEVVVQVNENPPAEMVILRVTEFQIPVESAFKLLEPHLEKVFAAIKDQHKAEMVVPNLPRFVLPELPAPSSNGVAEHV